MGLNTISTCVFWNLHECRLGEVDFGQQQDFAGSLSACNKAGMHAIVRPGPYVCAEWDLSGFPGGLSAEQGVKLRSSDPRFIEAANGWMPKVGELLAPLPVERGARVLLRGKFRARPVDTRLDRRKFGRGAVWLDGIHLGRYRNIDPQQTLFVPAVWLREDEDNELGVLESEKQGCPLTVPTVDEAPWSVATPAQCYVIPETFVLASARRWC